MPCYIVIKTVKVEMKDKYILGLVTKRLNLSFNQDGNYIQLKNGGYLNIKDKTIQYDSSYEKEVNEIRAYYGLEKAKLEAKKLGQSVYESIQDGKLALKVYVK